MNYHRENRTGGNSGKKYARRTPGEQTMHRAICSECNKECEVPFRPSGDKPVFCRTCFKNKGNLGPSGGVHNKETQQFEILNAKLDKILKALESRA